VARTELKADSVGRFALGCITMSLLCAALVVSFPQVGWLRGAAGSLGFNAGCWGTGVALRCSIRLRERLCYLASLLSLPNAILWGWLIHRSIHERAT
jgi:hypothetical protein